jgi:hypothetical protein
MNSDFVYAFILILGNFMNWSWTKTIKLSKYRGMEFSLTYLEPQEQEEERIRIELKMSEALKDNKSYSISCFQCSNSLWKEQNGALRPAFIIGVSWNNHWNDASDVIYQFLGNGKVKYDSNSYKWTTEYDENFLFYPYHRQIINLNDKNIGPGEGSKRSTKSLFTRYGLDLWYWLTSSLPKTGGETTHMKWFAEFNSSVNRQYSGQVEFINWKESNVQVSVRKDEYTKEHGQNLSLGDPISILWTIIFFITCTILVFIAAAISKEHCKKKSKEQRRIN